MVEYALMGAMAAVVILLLILRTNTAICFFALCAGSILLSASGDNMSLVASSLTSGLSSSTNVVQIALLMAPMAVCAVLLRGQLHKTLVPLGLIPAIAAAFLAAIFITPLLSDGTEGAIMQTQTWELLMQYKEPIVGLGLIASVILIVLSVRKPHDKHKKKH